MFKYYHIIYFTLILFVFRKLPNVDIIKLKVMLLKKTILFLPICNKIFHDKNKKSRLYNNYFIDDNMSRDLDIVRNIFNTFLSFAYIRLLFYYFIYSHIIPNLRNITICFQTYIYMYIFIYCTYIIIQTFSAM